MVMYLPPLRDLRTLCVRIEPCSAPVMICGSESVVEHLLLDGLRALLQRAVHTRAELQIGRHVGQVISKIIKALQFHRHLPYLPKTGREKPHDTQRIHAAN